MNKPEQEKIIDRHNKLIRNFSKRYSSNKSPITISFRKLLPEIKNKDRYTHLIHTYPAKLLVHIPYFFINNTILSKERDTILDPFNGSGTVMLEGLLANRNALGADSNPLARLIAEVKVSKFKLDYLTKCSIETVKKARRIKKPLMPDVVNREYWFSPHTISCLSKLYSAIYSITNDSVRKFMLVCFSNCVKKVSYADPRISVPVKLNPERYRDGSVSKKTIEQRLETLKEIDVYQKFIQIIEENIARYKGLQKDLKRHVKAKVISADARNLTESLNSKKKLKSNSVQLIITSPPYAGAQKYIRSSSLNLGWTGLAKPEELIKLDQKNIGRENYKKNEIKLKTTELSEADRLIKKVFKINPKRAQIVCRYINEMKEAFDEMIRVLKSDGYLVLVIGNNKVCEMEFNAQKYFTQYLVANGLKLQFKLIDDIRSYGLMTKRNKTADIISREWILVFKK